MKNIKLSYSKIFHIKKVSPWYNNFKIPKEDTNCFITSLKSIKDINVIYK